MTAHLAAWNLRESRAFAPDLLILPDFLVNALRVEKRFVTGFHSTGPGGTVGIVTPGVPQKWHSLFATTDATNTDAPLLFEAPDGSWMLRGTSTKVVVLPWSEYRARHAGVVRPEIVQAKVAFIGAGSFNQAVARALAPVFDAFVFVDPDTTSLANLSRSVLASFPFLDLPKVVAIEEAILSINPMATVETFPSRLEEVLDSDRAVLADASLIISAATIETGLILASEFADKPMIIAGMHARGASAEIFVSQGTRESPCFGCFRSQVVGTSLNLADRRNAYGMTARELVAEPALLADISVAASMVASIATRLLDGREAIPAGRNLLMVANQAGGMFERPFETLWVRVPVDPRCQNHGDENQVEPVDGSVLNELLPRVTSPSRMSS
jgi:molybdopterin/thiamine biosynthesis adenylyltransferase